MSASTAPSALMDGQCCASVERAPLAVSNRPGLSALAYRVGTHPQFKESLLARLGAVPGLQTRADDDLSIALLDAWACVADTLTFYQERIANESYLHTATERRSLIELGRLIDYRARPGVAAGAYLAFTIEDAPGAPELAAQPTTLGVGLKVQSVPAQGALPQTFETVEAIEARPEWNAIRPRRKQEQPLSIEMQTITVKGTNTNVALGDSILIVGSENDEDRVVKRVAKVTADTSSGTTRIDLVPDPPDPPRFVFPRLPIGIFRPQRRLLSSSFVADNILGFSWRQADLFAFAGVQKWSLRALTQNIAWHVAHPVLPPETIGVFAFRDRAAIFGHNAAKGTGDSGPANWDNPARNLAADANGGREVYLDRTYPGIIAGSWAVLESPTDRQIYRVEDNTELSRADFGLSAKVTRLRLSSDAGFDSFKMRETTVLAGSNALELAELPIIDDVEGASITLDGVYLGLKVGQTVIVMGARADLEGVVESELMTIAEVEFTAGFTTLVFQQALANSYVRDTVTINANVAAATHGETVHETLGGGDGAEAHQRFTLVQQPVTYVSSDSPSGGASTLWVRVNDLLWQEVPNFFGRAPIERVYVTHTSEQGKTTVEFGDGANGARVSTGIENIRATYRKGMGAAGNVDANQLTLLLTRPAGVRGVTNPLPASGGADPEPRDGIRRNAPVMVLTMDRIVSLQDYEDFARAFGGVAKALASPWIWSGHARGVFLTVAGADGADLPPDGRTYANLLAAIQKAGGSHIPVRMQSYRKAFFRLAGTVTVASDAQTDLVVAAVESALRSSFSFEARTRGQPVNLSEVMAVMQAAPGVVAIDLDDLRRTDGIGGDGLAQPLPAALPEIGDDGALLAAELLILDPRPVALKGVLQ
jgi:predicted phage baseplate assembly protein